MSITVLRALATAGLLVGVVACGSDDVTVPTADQLAEHLIDVDTFEGDWSVNVPDDAPTGAEHGVVTDEMQALLPRMDLCEEASDEARTAVQDLRWMAFRQIDLEVDDPIRPPDDRRGHMVFVQEFMIADEPDEIEATFELLRDGMTACLGEIPAGEEGPGLAEELALPDVGDDRAGAILTMNEAGDWAEWRLHDVLVRDGSVLVSLVVVDIRADDEPYYTLDQVGQMVATTVELL